MVHIDEITMSDVETGINKLKPNSAIGPDNIPAVQKPRHIRKDLVNRFLTKFHTYDTNKIKISLVRTSNIEFDTQGH
ncbi:hypothetical protein SFRURICE_018336 [Spodoptera frugiperda]|nr:hypothetical protein SFRURICE_018336 [Spodoptera frugiperda]